MLVHIMEPHVGAHGVACHRMAHVDLFTATSQALYGALP